MKKIIQNNRGLTLVEILAALVILGIVLVTFMSFFTQSAKFTAFNNEKLTAVQVAEDVVAQVRIGDLVIGSYEDYEVSIEIEEGPENLKKAIITVTSVSERELKSKPFITEMYFEEATP